MCHFHRFILQIKKSAVFSLYSAPQRLGNTESEMRFNIINTAAAVSRFLFAMNVQKEQGGALYAAAKLCACSR